MVTLQKLKTILSALIKYKIDVKADKSQVLYYEIEDSIYIAGAALEITDDGDGNVTATFTDVEITDDGDGNVTILSDELLVSDDGAGNVKIAIQ